MTDSTHDLVIVKLDRAKQALAEAKTIQECNTIVAIAGAMEIYAKRQQLGKDAIGYAYAIKVEALRQLGGLLKETPKNKGLNGSIVTGSNQEPVRDHTPTLAALGLTKKISMIAQQLATLPQALFEQVREGTISRTQALWDARHADETPTGPVAWSLESAKQRLRTPITAEIVAGGSHHDVAELLRDLANEVDEAARPELSESVSIARAELDIHDAEPGGRRFFETEQQAATHPGAPHVVASSKSTHQPWYRGLTTAQEGITPLTRTQVEARLDDIEMGKLPTKRTAHTHFAVLWAIKDLGRTSPLGRGGL